MDKFIEDTYEFIFELFENDVIKKKVRELLGDLGNNFFEERASGAKYQHHHYYEGGLAEHSAQVALDGYHSLLTKPWIKLPKDHILISGLLHDLDKVGRYTRELSPIVGDNAWKVSDIMVIDFIRDNYGLMNGQIQDGILLAHGGWVKNYNGEHPPISIFTHCADMYASHAIKNKIDTRKKIQQMMKEITKIKLVGASTNGRCYICNTKLLQPVKKVDGYPRLTDTFNCPACELKYVIQEKKIIHVE
jgi:hypothetical protein